MERFGNSTEKAIEKVKSLISKDLSDLLETDVSISLFSKAAPSKVPFTDLQNVLLSELIPVSTLLTLNFSNFVENPELLKG